MKHRALMPPGYRFVSIVMTRAVVPVPDYYCVRWHMFHSEAPQHHHSAYDFVNDIRAALAMEIYL